MQRQFDAGRRTMRRPAMRCAAVLIAVGGAVAEAQQGIQQDGRLFDANPSLNGRYNAARPISPLLGGNAAASGNVSGGFGLRSFAPIGDPNSFRAPLGSATLSDFRRDSFSVADSLSPYRGMLARPYYDADTTAPTAGYLQGYGSGYRGYVAPRPLASPGPLGQEANVLPGPLPGSAPLDLRLDPRVNSARSLRSQISGTPPQSRGALNSSIFGPPAGLRRSPAEEAFAAVQSPVVDLAPRPWTPSSSGEAVGARGVPRLPGTSDRLGTPLDVALRGDTTALLLNQTYATSPGGVEGDTHVPLRPGAMDTLRHEAVVEENLILPGRAPKIVDQSVLPGRDVFTDMRLAISLERDPSSEWFNAMRDAIHSDPTLEAELHDVARMQADQFIERVMKSQLKTFVGHSPTEVNNELLKAESLMDTRQYFDAAKRYDQAHLLDPVNPLPLIGKAHALLAAGEYQTAAVHLERGLERFPELTKFHVSLTDLMGGGEIVDIRRADIMSRLATREDPQLRFLLGYVEYHTGNERSGLDNLSRAAAASPAGSIIARYPSMLKGDGALPPPKLPTIEPVVERSVPSVPPNPATTPAPPPLARPENP